METNNQKKSDKEIIVHMLWGGGKIKMYHNFQ